MDNSQKLSADKFKWKEQTKFNEKFKKIYDVDVIFESWDMTDYDLVQVGVEYSKESHELHNDLPLLPERMKIKKCHKLVGNLYHEISMLHTWEL